MFTHVAHTDTGGVWKWILLSFLAGALVVGWVTKAAGEPPLPLAPVVQEAATPLVAPEEQAKYQTCLNLWLALSQHEQGAYSDAEATWRSIEVPANMHVWKELGLGAAILEQQRFTQAADLFASVTHRDPDNAAAYFLLGVARMRQAENAMDWNDAGPSKVRLVSWNLEGVPTESRSLYEMEALRAFERAIELAPTWRVDLPLAPYSWGEIAEPQGAVMPIVPPSVEHLLGSLGVEQIAVQAHVLSAQIQTHQGAFSEAEAHLDQATTAGFDTVDEYLELSKMLEAADQPTDARRVWFKAMEQDRLPLQASIARQLFSY